MTTFIFLVLVFGFIAVLLFWAGLDHWWESWEHRHSHDYDDGMMMRPPPHDWQGKDEQP